MSQFDKQFNKLIEQIHVSTSLNYSKKNIPVKKEPRKNKQKELPNKSKE